MAISAKFKGTNPVTQTSITIEAAADGGCEWTMEPGPFPSHGTIHLRPDVTLTTIPRVGMLIMGDGSTTVYIPGVWAWPEDATRDASGTHVVVPLQDARCRWQFGALVSEYNIRHDFQAAPTATDIQDMLDDVIATLTALTPSAVISVSGAIPSFEPKIRWEWASPAEALQELCDKAGLIIWPVLGAVDSDPTVGLFKVIPQDAVESLPGSPNTTAERNSSAPNLVPGKIVIVGDRTIRQMETTELEPVGEEKDGTIKPINDLSYGPGQLAIDHVLETWSWGKEFLVEFANLTDNEQQTLAKKCVLRWWRLPLPDDISDPELILNYIVDTEQDEEGNTRRRRPYLSGAWCDHQQGVYHNRCHVEQDGQIDLDIQVDGNLVKTSRPLYLGLFEPADPNVPHDVAEPGLLTLVFAYEMGPAIDSHYQYEHALDNATTDDVEYIRVPGLQLEQKYVDGEWVSQNDGELDEIAAALATAEAAKYDSSSPAGYTYAGIYSITADGGTRRVHYRADAGGAVTEVEKHYERLVGGRLPLQFKRYLMDLVRARKDLPVA